MNLKTISTQMISYFRLSNFLTFILPLVFAYSAQANSDQPHIHIRTLAASCAACHGTNGNSLSTTPVLAGLDATYFLTQMHAFKNGGIPSTVMHHHAKGLTDKEIKQLSHYFSGQQRVTSTKAISQPLKASHE